MRVHRAYLAGFGTSGSLLAGAAALFVVASAIIAFHGWPQIATGPATTNVAASSGPAPSHAARRLTAISAQRLAALGVSAGATHPGGAGDARRAGALTGGSAPAKRVVHSSSAARPVSSSPNTTASSCAQSACSIPGAPSSISGLTDTVAHDVSSIGNDVGSTVSRTSSTVAGKLGTVSPTATTTVQRAGSAAGNTVSTTAGTVAGALSGATGSGH